MNMFLRLSGLIGAPCAWAMNMQLGQIMPYVDCRTQIPWSAPMSGLLAITAAATALLPMVERGTKLTRAAHFVNTLSILVGMAFTFALALQVAATLMISPCQR
jgi:hypothetical protein